MTDTDATQSQCLVQDFRVRTTAGVTGTAWQGPWR